MPDASPQFDYFDGQLQPTHPALFERFAAANAAATGAEPDIRYGAHPRQTFDLFRSAAPARASIVYLHAGFWQSRDKSGFRFVAPPLVADGFDVALLNYPLCPEVSIAQITAATLTAMPCLIGQLAKAPIVLVGHSAGAHLAVEIGTVAAASGWNIAGIVAISGVFDLAPLIATTINAKLGLDLGSAQAASPLYRAVPGAPPAMFAVGAQETAAFQAQSRAMARAWAAAGNIAEQITAAGADHFSILTGLGDGAAPLGAAVHGFG